MDEAVIFGKAGESEVERNEGIRGVEAARAGDAKSSAWIAGGRSVDSLSGRAVAASSSNFAAGAVSAGWSAMAAKTECGAFSRRGFTIRRGRRQSMRL